MFLSRRNYRRKTRRKRTNEFPVQPDACGAMRCERTVGARCERGARPLFHRFKQPPEPLLLSYSWLPHTRSHMPAARAVPWYPQFGARSRWGATRRVEVINRAPTHRLSSSHRPSLSRREEGSEAVLVSRHHPAHGPLVRGTTSRSSHQTKPTKKKGKQYSEKNTDAARPPAPARRARQRSRGNPSQTHTDLAAAAAADDNDDDDDRLVRRSPLTANP
jgi:hypothetical protein